MSQAIKGPRYTVSSTDPLAVIDTKDTCGDQEQARVICRATDESLARFIAATCTAYPDLIEGMHTQTRRIAGLVTERNLLSAALDQALVYLGQAADSDGGGIAGIEDFIDKTRKEGLSS